MDRVLTSEQEAALRKLVGEGVLASWQHDAVRDALAEERVPTTARRSEILAYLGGGLVLVGAALTVATSWADLSRPARSLVVLGATAGLLLAGLLVSQHGSRAGRRRPGPTSPTRGSSGVCPRRWLNSCRRRRRGTRRTRGTDHGDRVIIRCITRSVGAPR
ncbi:DUF2157 domain-containing protein [Actinokineospora sp. NPDC004072]